MNNNTEIEHKRAIVETWVANLYPYITKKVIEDELKLGKDALYKYQFKNRKLPDKEVLKMYDFLKKKALIKTNDSEDEDD